MTAGEQIRDFMPVEAVARTFLDRASVLNPSASLVQVFNLSSCEPISIRCFAERWWKYWKAKRALSFGKVNYRSGEVMRYVAGENLIWIGRGHQVPNLLGEPGSFESNT